MTKVSIIVPIYNLEHYLRQCLDSCINQTLRDIEVICVNDGSIDNCSEIINEYAIKDNRIKIINQDNQGLSIARNHGMDIAQGEYILFLDSDDWLALDCCEVAYNQAKENNNDFICFSYYNCDNNGEIINHTDFNKLKNIIKNKQINPKSVKDSHYIQSAFVWNKIYNRRWLNDNHIKFIKMEWEDLPFTIMAFINSSSFSLINKPLYYYRNREDSLTKRVSIKGAIKSKTIPLTYILKTEDNKNLLKTYMNYYFASLFWWYKKLPNNRNEKLQYKELMMMSLQQSEKYDFRAKLYLLLLKMNISFLYYAIRKAIQISKFVVNYILNIFYKPEVI